MADHDDLDVRVHAVTRLVLAPDTLTADDVEALAGMSPCLGWRGAICYELRRAGKPKTKKPTKTTSRRRKAQ